METEERKDETNKKTKPRAKKETTKTKKETAKKNDGSTKKRKTKKVEEAVKESVEEIKTEDNVENKDIKEKTAQEETAAELTNEVTVMDEEAKPIEEAPIEDKAPNANKTKLPTSTIVLGVICIVLAIVLLFGKFGSTKIDLKNFAECFAEKQATITLPNDYLLSSEGQLFVNEKGVISPKGAFGVAEISEEEYDNAMASYGEHYDIKTLDNAQFKITKLSLEEGEAKYDYYFIFKDGITVQFIFFDTDDSAQSKIINSLNY